MVLSHQSPDLSSRVEMLEGLVRSLLDSRTQTSLNDTRQLSPSLLGDLDQCFFPSVRAAACFRIFFPLTSPSTYAVQEVDSQNDDDDASPSTATPPQTNDSLTVLDQQLLQIYVTHVDPIFPILQCSSLRGYVTKGLPYLTYAVDHPAPKALVCAIGYIAITTLSDSACSQELSLSRDLLLDRYHRLTEHALEQADYYNSDDLTVLQAFVLFLVCGVAIFNSYQPDR